MMSPEFLQTIAAAASAAPDMNQVANADTLGALLGSVQMPNNPMAAPAYAIQPDAPRAINPAFSQQMMQLLLSLSGPRESMPSLGALLGGRA